MFLWYHLSYHVLNFTHERDWTNSVLPNPCGGDAITCLCGLFCIPCLTCSNARHLGQSGLVYCLLSCFCNPIAAFLLRQKAREKFWIDGSDCEDFVSWCYNKCTFIIGKLTIDYFRFVHASVIVASTARPPRKSKLPTTKVPSGISRWWGGKSRSPMEIEITLPLNLKSKSSWNLFMT